MGADGSIIIDTRINTDGLNSGVVNAGNILNKLKTSIKGVGVAIGAAFAVRQIVQFGKEASKAAREASDSMMGLRSILEGQGRSFSDAKKFIDEYIQDGLIPATDATTAYKNLASRGYDDTQIQQVMTALKDASAYGRQASYSMGEAVKSATEGLKNENSILVDNAGVTKNVAKMWEDYARSIGTTSQNLTQQQKIQAEVSGILAETRFQTGDAARVANTLTGELQRLSFGFNNFKIAVGNIVNPILKTFLPVINAALNAVTRFANTIATFVNNFFGTEMNMMSSAAENVSAAVDSSAASTENLAGSTEDAAKATKKAQKANKSYLSGLDDIKRFTSDNDTSSGSTGGSSVKVPSASSGASNGLSTLPQKTNPVLTQVESRFSQFAAKLKGFMEPLTVQVQRFAQIAGEAFLWFYNNVLKLLGTWTVNEVLPRFFQTLANVLNIVNNVLIALKPLWQWFWNTVLKPIASWTADKFLKAWDCINSALNAFAQWAQENPEVIQNITLAITTFFAAFKFANLINSVSDFISAFGGIAGVVKNVGKLIMPLFSNPWVLAISAVIAAIVLIVKNWDEIKDGLKKIWDKIADWAGRTWETIKKNAKQSWDNITGFLKKTWSGLKSIAKSAFEGVKSVVSTVWNGIKSGVSTVWNGIKNTLSTAWNGIKNTASTVFGNIKNTVSSAWSNVKSATSTAWSGIKSTASSAWNSMKTTASSAFSGIKNTVNNAWSSIQSKGTSSWSTISTKIVGVFTNISTKASQMGVNIKSAFLNAFNGLVNLIKRPVNGIIGFINGMIRGVVNGINAILRAFNSLKVNIPSWVPGYGGRSLGFNFRMLTAPQIPYLAKGAVIPPNAPFMAMLGDQKRGTNIEAPLSTIEEALENVLAKRGMNSGNNGGSWRFTAQINRRTLFDELLDEAKIRQMRTGRNPFEMA